MKKLMCFVGLMVVLALWTRCGTNLAANTRSLESLQQEFQAYAGTRLVFHRDQLSPGDYYDRMPVLSAGRMLQAAEICLAEVRKYPPGFLGGIHLKSIGVFAACVSKSGDGFRPYSPELGGYRYYGMWNGAGGVVASYYTDEQLPLTFHHEIFHHVQATRRGVVDAARYANGEDPRYRQAIAGEKLYPPPAISAADLAALRRISQGQVLRGAVSDYAAKNENEDQAETARYFMTTLADSLVQAADQPALPGSQRILDLLARYHAAGSPGPAVDWFVDVALGRTPRGPAVRPAEKPVSPVAELITQLGSFAYPGSSGWDGLAGREDQARMVLAAAARIDRSKLTAEEARTLVDLAATVTHQLLRCRLRASGQDDAAYAIWGGEGADGVNWTLRQDVVTFGSDAQRLKQLGDLAPAAQEEFLRTELKNLRLVARYYTYINSNWTVTTGTRRVFESTRDAFADALPAAQKSLSVAIKSTDLGELATRIPVDGTPVLLERPARSNRVLPPSGKHLDHLNAYLDKVDEAIADPEVRAAIRRVQPACVRFPRASGCCISPKGVILTAAHVADRKGEILTATFPDGTRYKATCTAIDHFLDVAVMQIKGVNDLPFAPLAPAPPEAGTWICAIGQPGSTAPDGSATGYEPFYVSTGHIRGFRSTNPLASQGLGGVKHDAWTYWGHSGCPLFNDRGQIVAMHNSWDSETAMRHGVTYEAIVHFLRESGVDFAVAQ
jgi:S1-C subfamily serine protease